MSNQEGFDAVIVGAGFAGLYALHTLRGLGLRCRVFEAGGGVGGTWYWNRYPGARCDIVSMEYSYQFSEELQQEWNWTERYASQPEILRYLEHVADRFDLRRDIQLDTRVAAAIFDENRNRWQVETADGEELDARFLVMATGCLSKPLVPRIPGMDRFAGETLFTSTWPHEAVDFTGKRVAVIGTGSSGIQSIPIIARQSAHLYVFQRTANYSVPAHNGPLDPADQKRIKADYAGYRRRWAAENPGCGDFSVNWTSALAVSEAERRREYEARWQSGGLPFLGAFADLMFDERANRTAADFFHAKIRGAVRDPATAEKLVPRQTWGCKRLCVDTDYYETFNRSNVTLVDLNESPIEEITPRGIRTRDREYEIDSIVFATGFDAMTGALFAIDIRGREGLPLRDKWSAGPLTYLGLATAGFPNFFLITGPGSPSVLSNMVCSIEQHVNLIADLIARANGGVIEAEPEAEQEWIAHVNAVADATLFRGCNSWYLGANVPGKPRVFMPYFGFPQYVEKCNEMAAAGYKGFTFSGGNL